MVMPTVRMDYDFRKGPCLPIDQPAVSLSVFGRINQGYHFPGFDDLRSGTPQSQQVQNYEVGYRAQTSTVYGVIDVFRRRGGPLKTEWPRHPG